MPRARCLDDDKASGVLVQGETCFLGLCTDPLLLQVQFCSALGLRSLTFILGRGQKGQMIKKKNASNKLSLEMGDEE